MSFLEIDNLNQIDTVTATFDVVTTYKNKTRRINCRAENCALFAKASDSNAWVEICPFHIPFSSRRMVAAIRRLAVKHFAPAPESVEDLYFIAARQVEEIALCHVFKANDTMEIWSQRGETIGCQYDLWMDEQGQPAQTADVWTHVQEIAKRTPVFDASCYQPAVTNPGLDEIKETLLAFANRAKAFGAQQQALFA